MICGTPAAQEAVGKEETMTAAKALPAVVGVLLLAGGLACKRNHPPDVPAIPGRRQCQTGVGGAGR
jgi:hypothetical protein